MLVDYGMLNILESSQMIEVYYRFQNAYLTLIKFDKLNAFKYPLAQL